MSTKSYKTWQDAFEDPNFLEPEETTFDDPLFQGDDSWYNSDDLGYFDPESGGTDEH